MNDTREVMQVIPFQVPVKALMSVLSCFFFLYVNCVMLFALLRKPHFMECSRYMLFGHLLLTDSMQLMMSLFLYTCAVAKLRLISYVCIIFTLLTSLTVKMSPISLALMSLERYVAVCFPLRHAGIATSRTTVMAIAVMWTVASVESFTHIFLFVRLNNTVFTLPGLCRRRSIFHSQIFATLHTGFNIVCFVLVSVIVIFTYFAIMITVKLASSNARSSSKAHKTVLLHLLQLCLCLTSMLFDSINSRDIQANYPTIFVDIQYAFFVILIIFPKCLSPLIYGLRDQTFRYVFIYYFTFGFKSTVKLSPKS